MKKYDQKTQILFMRKYIMTVSRATGVDIEDFDKVLKEITGEKHVASAIFYGARFIEGVSIPSLFDLFTRFGEELSELLDILQTLKNKRRKIKRYQKKDKDIPKKLEKETEKLEKFYNKAIKRISKFSGFNRGAKFKNQYSRINNLVKGKGYEYRGLMYDEDYDEDFYDYDDYETAAMHRSGLDLSFEGLMGNTRRGGSSKKYQRGLMPDYDESDEEDDYDEEEGGSRMDQLENMIIKLTGVVSNMSEQRNRASNIPIPSDDDDYCDEPEQNEEMSNMMQMIGALSSQVASITTGLNQVVDRLNDYDECAEESIVVSSSQIIDTDAEEDCEPQNGSLTPRNS